MDHQLCSHQMLRKSNLKVIKAFVPLFRFSEQALSPPYQPKNKKLCSLRNWYEMCGSQAWLSCLFSPLGFLLLKAINFILESMILSYLEGRLLSYFNRCAIEQFVENVMKENQLFCPHFTKLPLRQCTNRVSQTQLLNAAILPFRNFPFWLLVWNPSPANIHSQSFFFFFFF